MILHRTQWILTILAAATIAGLAGCSFEGYSNSWPYPAEYKSVYIEMFDSGGFRRGYEFVLTDAVAKAIETRTQYKIVSSADRADTILTGQVNTGSAVLVGDRFTGTPLEREALVEVSFTWKNLKTGEILVEDTVTASASYSTNLGQRFEYAAQQAVNKAAMRVVDKLEIPWQ